MLDKAFSITALAEFNVVWTPFIFSPSFLFGGPQALNACVCGLPKPI
jgi:hypothetical protein